MERAASVRWCLSFNFERCSNSTKSTEARASAFAIKDGNCGCPQCPEEAGLYGTPLQFGGDAVNIVSWDHGAQPLREDVYT